MRKPGSNGAETLRSLRSAAIELIAEHGYEAMNLRMLGNKVGVTPASFYRYFENKQQLLFSLVEEVTRRLTSELAAISKRLKILSSKCGLSSRFIWHIKSPTGQNPLSSGPRCAA